MRSEATGQSQEQENGQGVEPDAQRGGGPQIGAGEGVQGTQHPGIEWQVRKASGWPDLPVGHGLRRLVVEGAVVATLHRSEEGGIGKADGKPATNTQR